MKEKQQDGFSTMATQHRTGLFRDFWDYMKQHKKWWMLPILIMLLLVGALIILGSSAAAPFIYSLF